jgi:cell division protein FtsQ
MSERRGLSAANVAAPADKRFRRAETRPGRKSGGWLRSKTFRWGVAMLFVLGVSALGLSAAVRAQMFSINRVVVRGNTHLSTGEVLAIVDGLRGGSLFAVDLETYRAKLLGSRWVADATMRRVLPSTIDLRIVERVPMAVGRLGDQLYLVDPAGVIIDEYGPQYVQYDLPIVDGLVSTPSAGSPVVDPERARLAARFVDALAAAPALRAHIAQINVSNPHNLVALIDQDPALLYVGDTDFVARLQRYLEMAPTLKEQITDIDYVDLRFEERIPVNRKRPATSADASLAAAAKGKN